MAVAHRLLTIAWHIIQEGTVYQELGGSHHDRLHPEKSARRLMRRLEQIGFEVSVKPKAAEAAPVVQCLTASTNAVGRRGSRLRSSMPGPAALPKPLERKPADPVLCPRCARWGIPCIHVRNARRSLAPAHPTESVT